MLSFVSLCYNVVKCFVQALQNLLYFHLYKENRDEECSISWHALSDIFFFLQSEGGEEERGQKFERFCNTSRDFPLQMFIGYYTHDFPSL